MLSSIFFNQLNPILPSRFDIPGPPLGGFTVVEPVSFVAQARAGLLWVDELAGSAVAASEASNPSSAHVALCQAGDQLSATADSILADSALELDGEATVAAQGLIGEVRNALVAAGALVETDPAGAIAEIETAREGLLQALAVLGNGRRVVLDVFPGKCDQSLSRWPARGAVVRAAIVGMPEKGLPSVDRASLALVRADGVGEAVHPVDSRRGPAIQFGDVTGPVFGEVCDCQTADADGLEDMVLQFLASDVVASLALRSLRDGAVVPLMLTGSLVDGTLFRAVDCVSLGGRPSGLRSTNR
jgi:hypothetical protein